MHNLFEIPSITLFLCVFCAFLWLIKHLFSSQQIKVRPKGLHSFTFFTLNFKFASTLVVSALQIGPFCSNKANFRKSQVNITIYMKRDYVRMDTWSIGKNKPNSNPIQTQFKPNQSQYKPNSKPNKPNFRGKRYCIWRSAFLLDIMTNNSYIWSLISVFSLETTFTEYEKWFYV